MKIDNCPINYLLSNHLHFMVMCGMHAYICAHVCLLTQPDIFFLVKLILKTCAKEPSPNISSTVISLQCVMASLPKFAKNYKHKKIQ